MKWVNNFMDAECECGNTQFSIELPSSEAAIILVCARCDSENAIRFDNPKSFDNIVPPSIGKNQHN